MATVTVEDQQRAGALVLHGHEACFPKAVSLLESMGLPNGLLPLQEIEEVGFVESTGFFWVRQKTKKDKSSSEHTFKAIRTTCSYAREVTGFLEPRRLRKITGVKAKELLLWVSIVDIFTDESKPDQTFFKSAAGIGRWHPSTAFSLPQQ